MSKLDKRVRKQALKLLKKTSCITSLGVKNLLRNKFPDDEWTQRYVSGELKKLYQAGSIDGLYYVTTNSGGNVHRVYLTGIPTSTSSKASLWKPAATKAKAVTRTALLTLILASKGKKFTINFTTLGGSPRIVNGELSKKPRNVHGYIAFVTVDGDYKTIVPRLVTGAIIDNVSYTIK